MARIRSRILNISMIENVELTGYTSVFGPGLTPCPMFVSLHLANSTYLSSLTTGGGVAEYQV